MAASSRIPVVVILGATGTGKSKLAIELGRALNGEIISADSMQIYKGLDIITNKVTQEEQGLCRHHMIDYVSPLQARSTVVEFRNTALPIIDNLMQVQRKLPIIVGGTNYYIEALLWNFLINKQDVLKASQESSIKHKLPKVELHDQSTTCKPLSHITSQNGAWTAETDKNEQDLFMDNSEGCKEKSDLHINISESIKDKYDLCIENSESNSRKHECVKDLESNKDKLTLCNESAEGSILQVDRENSGHRETGCDIMAQNGSLEDVSEVTASCRWDDKENDEDGEIFEEKYDNYANMATAELHRRLREVDFVSAQRIHPHDRRKIIRALSVFEESGIPLSEIHRAQHSSVADVSGPLRYPHTCILWIQAQQDVLDERLDNRVDTMLQAGLVEEMLNFHEQYNAQRLQENRPADYTTGIFQSIGFKEFHSYLLLTKSRQQSEEGKRLLEEGFEEMKKVTRRYARRQIQWIKNRFLKRPGADVPAVYGLDGTDVSLWEDKVLQPALDIVQACMQDSEPKQVPLPYDGDSSNRPSHNVCELCGGRVFVTQFDWEAHLRSRKHQKLSQKKRKQEREKQDSSGDVPGNLSHLQRKAEATESVLSAEEILQDAPIIKSQTDL